MEVTTREISQEQAIKFCSQFAKERVDAKRVCGARYIGAFVRGKLVGCCGWVLIGSVLRYKGDCVLQNFRMNGIYELLFSERDKITETIPRKKNTAFCTAKSLRTYLRHGFCSITTKGNGITFVSR